MGTNVNKATQVILDKLESQINTAQAKLDTLKARAETAADSETKAVAELLTKKQTLQRELEALKKLGGDSFQQAKADLEARIAQFEKSVKDIESKAKAS